ncbi:methyltransferase [Amycolatopsis sp. NPDC059090]|uniref:methyltransferase n=1 Tax=unclassified Amycolatopsis TaxID=2618356 RepID=UPI00366FA270
MTDRRSAVPPEATRLREIALSGGRAAAVRAAAKLGIADVLGDEPATLAELASATDTDPVALERLLRALTWHGVFAEHEDGRFVHTASSLLLREADPHSVKYIVLWGTEPWTWELWPHLEVAVRSGKSVFPALHDKGFFEYLGADAPESAEIMDRAMIQSSNLSVRAIADTLDLTETDSVADICGGRGQVLAALMERNPGVTGTLFDRQGAVDTADPRLRAGGEFADRARLVAGDCREAVPIEADAYILKSILDWDDESTISTLENIAASAKPGARVFVIENLLDGEHRGFSTSMDLLLMLNVGGRKRTTAAFTALIEKAGLHVRDVRPIDTYLHVIESTVGA